MSMAVMQVRELTDVTSMNAALLPFYARITATLSQISSTIQEGVLASLERSFKYYKVSLSHLCASVQPW